MTKEEVLQFIKSESHMVISTYGEIGLESALIGFGQTDNFELIFGTEKTTRKYKNLQTNPHATFVIGLGKTLCTVQYEGEAREITGGDLEKYSEMYFTKLPFARKYKSLPNQSYWLVTPKWVRYSDISTSPSSVVEFTFEG